MSLLDKLFKRCVKLFYLMFILFADFILQAKWLFQRSNLILLVLFLACICLIMRAVWLQIISIDFLRMQGASRYTRTLRLPAIRGKITDRNGQVLALSIPIKTILAIPQDVLKTSKEKLNVLVKLLGISKTVFFQKLHSNFNFVYLKRDVEPKIVQEIIKLGIVGIKIREEYKRFYPTSGLTAPIIGFTSIENQGQDGIELSWQKVLTGITGSRRVIQDRLGRIVEDMQPICEPHNGVDLMLSIDLNIQNVAFNCLHMAVKKSNAKTGSLVVIDIITGEILALANSPTYNPNDRSKLVGMQLRNRGVTDAFEPGSTFKPFTIALALDTQRVTPATIFQTSPGYIKFGTTVIKDARAYGLLTVSDILKKSSNIGVVKIALNVPSQELWEMFKKLGFGQRPQFSFPGAAAGYVRHYKLWKPIEQATMSYGHGISVSLIQLAHAYLIFARDGDLIPLSLVKIDSKPDGHHIISKNTALQMRNMLEKTVAVGGTALKAQVHGYRVGGKTGTAYKIIAGKYVKKYIASFVGIAPISHPRLIVALMIDEPHIHNHYGGTVAAPVFSDVMSSVLRYLKINPDFKY